MISVKLFKTYPPILFLIVSCGVSQKGNLKTDQKADLFAKPENVLPVTGKFLFKSAAELASLIKRREATSEEIVKEFIAHIKNNNHKYNAIVWLREEEALADARKADEAVALGKALSPLHGVPVTVKEEYWVKGGPVTLNSKMYKDFIAPDDGPLVKQLKKSGAIVLGKSNLPTLLMDFQTQGELYPTASNPYDTTRTPGGSSGGAAAALAAGFTSIELGSDLGGSIRIPSSYCGLYGLKTTFGSLNTSEGDGADTSSKKKRYALNVAGPMARTAEDLEAAWRVLRDAKPDPHLQKPIQWKEPSGRSLDKFRIGWVDEWKKADRSKVKVGSLVKDKLKSFIDSLKQHDVAIENTYPDIYYDEMMKSYMQCLALLAGEGASEEIKNGINKSMEPWDDGSGTLAPFFETMKNPDDAAWQQWQKENENLKSKWSSYFKNFDFLICPITYGPAIKKCPKGTPIFLDGDTISYFNYAPYTTVINPMEVPCITIPLGLNREGLPIAVQIIGSWYAEPELLYFAKLIRPLVSGFVKPVGL